MFNHDYLAVDVVNTTVSHIGDQTLEVEIMQHHSTLAHLDVNREQQKCLRLEQEQLELELGMCGHCLLSTRLLAHSSIVSKIIVHFCTPPQAEHSLSCSVCFHLPTW